MSSRSAEVASGPEQSVADKRYRDSAAKVEPYGVEPIPDSERHGSPVNQFAVWFTASLNVPVMLLGFYPVLYGLSLWQSLLSVFAGAVLGAVGMGLLSAMGTKLGVAVQIQARGACGYFGNFAPVAIVNVFAAAGWAAVNTVFGALALVQLVSMPFWLAAVIVSVVQFAISLYGYNMIHLVARWMTLVLGGLTLALTVIALGKADWSFGANPKADLFIGEAGGIVTMFGFFFSFLLAWMPFASDYSRYLPASTPSRKVAWWTGLGNFASVLWMGWLGVFVAKASDGLGLIDAVKHLTGSFGTVAMIVVLLSLWTVNGLNIYGGSISLLTLRVPVSRATGVGLVTLAALLLALWAHGDVYGRFYAFLVVSGYFISPYIVVILLDWVLRRRVERPVGELYDRGRAFDWGFVAWLAGCAASVPFWVWTKYTGPFAAAHSSWGDLSYYVAAIVAGIVYVATYRLGPLRLRAAARTGGAIVEPPAHAEVRVGQ
jgi:purine-cytosine permease-like protein